MRVVIINPNSTASMTDAMVETARAAAPELAFEGWTSQKGPPAIQGVEDGDAATPPLLELVRRADESRADGIMIGCFDDTGLREAAASARCPVVGIGQASYHFAALRTWRFSVVTTLGVSVPVIDGNIRNLGLGGFLGRVRASNVPVLSLESDQANAEDMVVNEAVDAEREDGIDCLILGCAGMVRVAKSVRERVDIRVIDPVETAARCFLWT